HLLPQPHSSTLLFSHPQITATPPQPLHRRPSSTVSLPQRRHSPPQSTTPQPSPPHQFHSPIPLISSHPPIPSSPWLHPLRRNLCLTTDPNDKKLGFRLSDIGISHVEIDIPEQPPLPIHHWKMIAPLLDSVKRVGIRVSGSEKLEEKVS
ncbi:pollen-specific leucine-rich repeat extensin-like protein 1, partial [Helianthus annuus]|uniref:pollen-specific leucine-rich repeat extensin-like protein 1 n=1 Tax=Helianthus annuus TaxID=4232 RepID=UPI001653104E